MHRSVALVVTAVAVVAGVMVSEAHDPTPARSPAGAASVPVSGRLADVRVAPAGSMSGYSRAQFGHGWASVGHGCTTRDQILVRDSTDQPGESDGGLRGGCYPLNPHLLDPYTGRWLDGRLAIQIDHIVPEAVAWRSGAVGWSAAERERFANDPTELVAVGGSGLYGNEAKGDSTPDEWQPQTWHCGYAERYVAVLVSYRLTVTPAARDALAGMLGQC